MELRDALSQIAEIRQKVVEAEQFRGYRALTQAFSGVLAVLAACCQTLLVPDPVHNVNAYLCLWVGAAVLSIFATGWEMVYALRRSKSVLDRHKTYLAVTQFLPAIGAGGLLTFVLYTCAPPENLWVLPGLWCMLFSLGIFASCRLLPPVLVWPGVYYLFAGAVCLMVAQGDHALSPWAMGLPFGVGQLLTASLLYWTLERDHDQAQEDA
jgi:hypothetical protein